MWLTFFSMIRVFLLDDHNLVRQALKGLLDAQEDIQVVGDAETATDALVRIPLTKPDVALLDVRLGESSGIEVCREVRSLYPEVACLFLTAFSDDEALVAAMMAGASGYVLKEIKVPELLGAVRDVAAGKNLLDQASIARLREESRHDPRLEALSPRERKILELMVAGMTNRQIAAEIFLAEKTVKNYVSNLLAKLGLANRTQAVAYVLRSAHEFDQPPRYHGRESQRD